MARKNKKKKKHYDLDQILAGRTLPGPLELIRLIHRINPTNEKMAAEQKALYYKKKSGLQSLLLKHYGHQVKVELDDPNNLDLIGLSLNNFSENACHALISELDEEAASLARKKRDELLAHHPDPEPEATPAPKAVTGAEPAVEVDDDLAGYSRERLVECGRQALEEYDFLAGERFYQRAYELSQGDPEAALMLLEVLVDYLADYEKVRILSEKLPSKALRDTRVRLFLALAAARSHQIEAALTFADRVSDPRHRGDLPRGNEALLRSR